MATIKQLFGTNTALTVTGLATLADTGTATSNEVDNSTDLNLNVDVQVELTGTGTSTVDIYLMRSNATTVYPSNDATSNMDYMASVDMSATTPKVDFRIEQLPKYFKLVFINNSGNALTASTVKLMSANLTNT